MTRDATVTRERLLRAGERLFAERGIDAVRVREINQLAKQRNSSALHYHFGSREGLLAAILTLHRGPIEARRIEILDQLERDRRTDDLHALVGSVVTPLAAELSNDSGRDYLRILPQLMGRIGLPIGKLPDTFGPDGMRRTLRLANRCLTALPPVLREERLALGMELVSYAVARRATDIEMDAPFRLPEPEFLDNLVDMTVGMLTAPISAGLRPSAR